MAEIDHLYAAIMAGGGGTRLWPLSRHSQPKQLLELFDEHSLYRMAVDRLQPIMTVDSIIVLTIPELVPDLRRETPELPSENYFIEPSPRGNAAAIGLAALRLYRRDEQAVMACLTADHLIRNVESFHALLGAACEAALQGSLVTLGIEPEAPDPAYGYIHRGDEAGMYAGMQAYRVEAFKEKPPPEQAERYVESGEYAWNSGMFVWQVKTVLDEIDRQMPQLGAALNEIRPALGTKSEKQVVERVWPSLEKLSIDYGIMEGAQDVLMIPAHDLGWYDVGDWSRLYELLQADEQGNVIRGENVLLRETGNSLIFKVRQESARRLIVMLGVEDLVLVDTGDVLMVCDRSHAADVKKVVDELAQRDMHRYL
jgi:mannose-1-phosphate guanylyltransferase